MADEPVRVLFVDDEQTLRFTMPEILRREGFQVTAVGSVNEALAAITMSHFDVLISDLNIGYPSDGLTVVSAMRRTQPDCVTLILTGYPGFETALEAIRTQVDDYLVKPTAIPTLVDLIQERLKSRLPQATHSTKRISAILRENLFEISRQALVETKADPQLRELSLTDEQRIEDIPRLVGDLAATLESREPVQLPFFLSDPAEQRGRSRFRQGYTAALLAAQFRILQGACLDAIHKHLATVNLSYFMFDLKRLCDGFGIQLEYSLRALLAAQRYSLRNESETPQ
jgi:ActR/RegA family two-component response regulator